MTADSLGKFSDLLGEVKSVLTGAVSSGDPTLLTSWQEQMDEFVTRGMDYREHAVRPEVYVRRDADHGTAVRAHRVHPPR